MEKNKNLFFITISNLDVDIKSVLYTLLLDDSEQLCVATESHASGKLHHHIYMKSIYKFTFVELRQHLNVLIDETTAVDIQGCKSSRNTLKYITKEDFYPLIHNINKSQLSFGYQATDWANSITHYDPHHPFILSHPQYYKYLAEVYQSVKSKKQSLDLLKNYYTDLPLPQWKQEVYNWWIDWVENGWHHKKPQLYLHGPANTGKTYFINQLIAQNTVYEPTPNTVFAYEDYNNENVIFTDEFCFKSYDLNVWKKATAGESFKLQKKGLKSMTIEIKKPYIMVSNYPPINSPGIQERLLIISVKLD